ncbi:MAG: hypothetical protein K6G22_10405 [Lachnospiraceae bacterium]|nr:hypothetical protein [Lachnospiraceae bacterium]
MIKILLYIISVMTNAVFFVILRTDLYTDRYHLPDGEMGVHTRSPIERIYTADNPVLLYLQILSMIISTAAALLLIFGVKGRIVKTVWITGMIASAVIFVIILVYTKTSVHPHY